MGAVSEGSGNLGVHLDEVVLHHILVALILSGSDPGLEGCAHLGVEDVDDVL